MWIFKKKTGNVNEYEEVEIEGKDYYEALDNFNKKYPGAGTMGCYFEKPKTVRFQSFKVRRVNGENS